MAAVQGYNAIIDSYNPKVAFSGFSVACVGSVSSRVIARKFPSPPLPLPLHSFFLLSSQCSRRPRAETLATQARFTVDISFSGI